MPEELRIKSQKELLFEIINSLKKDLIALDLNIEMYKRLLERQPEGISFRGEIANMEERKKNIVEVLEIAVQKVQKEEGIVEKNGSN